MTKNKDDEVIHRGQLETVHAGVVTSASPVLSGIVGCWRVGMVAQDR